MKYRNPLLIPIIIIAIFMFVADCTTVFGASVNNETLAKEYAKHNYPNCKIVMLKKYDANKIENRADKNIVYIEKFVSYSKGKYGYSKNGYYVKYNKRVKKGKKVVSYFIYNPYTNYSDDVVAVVDNHKIR